MHAVKLPNDFDAHREVSKGHIKASSRDIFA